MAMHTSEPLLRVFVHGSPRDARLGSQVRQHLRCLERVAAVRVLDEQDPPVVADVALLLTSPAYLETMEDGLSWILGQQERHGLRILPVVLRSSGWRQHPRLQHLQPLPRDGKSLAGLDGDKRDEAIVAICEEVARLAGEILPAAPVPLPPPPLAAYRPEWYIHRPTEERQALMYLQHPGHPAVICGPELLGKTWLLLEILRRAREQLGLRDVCINLKLFDGAARTSLGSFLRELAEQIIDAAGGGAHQIAALWHRQNPMSNLGHIMEQVLDMAPQGLVLAIDEADALLGAPYAGEFFGMLRAWAQRDSEIWGRLRLLLSISVRPDLLIENVHQSPFNLTQHIELGDLPFEALQELARRHHVKASDTALGRLRALVGGHPYLLRLFFCAAALRGQSMDLVLDEAPDGQGICDAFLAGLRRRILRVPGQGEVLRRVAQGQPVDEAAGRRLLRSGLLREESSGVFRLRHAMYREIVEKLEAGGA